MFEGIYIYTFQLALSGARIGVRWTINAMKPCRTYRLKTLGSHNWAWAMGQYLWHSNLKTSRGGKEHAVNIQGKSKIVEVEDVAVDRWSTSPLFIWLQPSFWCRNSHPRIRLWSWGAGAPPPSDDSFGSDHWRSKVPYVFFGWSRGI